MIKVDRRFGDTTLFNNVMLQFRRLMRGWLMTNPTLKATDSMIASVKAFLSTKTSGTTVETRLGTSEDIMEQLSLDCEDIDVIATKGKF